MNFFTHFKFLKKARSNMAKVLNIPKEINAERIAAKKGYVTMTLLSPIHMEKTIAVVTLSIKE